MQPTELPRGRRISQVRRAPPRQRRLGRRAVSDVVATILLLALTVTLFASIFAFVTTFPQPPAQNNNQFQASLTQAINASSGGKSYVTSLHILHLAGPPVAGNSLVYLKSANNPAKPEFQSPYTVSSGLGGSNSWNLGQIWNLTFPNSQRPPLPDNITVYIVASSQLLFSVILPGTTVPPPPTIVATYTSPATPAKGQGFTVLATVQGNYGLNSVYVNLAGVPGSLPATPQIMTQNGQGQWTYVVAAGLTTTNGTFYGFVNASNSFGQQTSAAVVITISTGSFTTATITLNPTTHAAASAVVVQITGAGFSASSKVLLSYNGVVFTPASCTTGTLGGTNVVTTTAGGAFVCTWNLGAAPGFTGTYPFTANDLTSGQSATAYFVRT